MKEQSEVIKLISRAILFLALLVFVYFMARDNLFKDKQVIYLVIVLLAWANGKTFKAIEDVIHKIISK